VTLIGVDPPTVEQIRDRNRRESLKRYRAPGVRGLWFVKIDLETILAAIDWE